MPAGGSALNRITLAGGTIQGVGGIQWDGKYLDIADGASGTIFQTNGSAILGSVTTAAVCSGQIAIVNRRRIVVPHPCSASTGVYAYPAGGSALKTASGGQQAPEGVAISVNP